MNKWQIICPLVALAIVAVGFALISGSHRHRYYVYAQTRMIGGIEQHHEIPTIDPDRLGVAEAAHRFFEFSEWCGGGTLGR